MRQAVVLEEVLVVRTRPRGSMLMVCSVPGCATLTMGGTCVVHDPPVTATYERGRPFAPKTPAILETTALGA